MSSSIILLPDTCKAKISSLPPNCVFSDNVLSDWMASMGEPAATFPTSGIWSSIYSTVSCWGWTFCLSSEDAKAVSFKQRALPVEAFNRSCSRRAAMCSNTVLRLIFNVAATSAIVAEQRLLVVCSEIAHST